MATHTDITSDRAIGYAMLFGVLGVVGSALLFVAPFGPGDLVGAAGFALAMIAGLAVVIAVQVYD